MHRTGRVMAWDVEGFEVVVVVFDLRTFGNAVAYVSEELFDSLQRPGNRMQAARGLTATGQGDVDLFGSELGAQLGFFECRLARIEDICNTFLGFVDQRTHFGPLIGRQVAQGLHHLSQLTLLAKELNPDLLQGIDVFSVLHGLQSLRDQRIQVFHVQTPDTK
jgi:hypothetical protein